MRGGWGGWTASGATTCFSAPHLHCLQVDQQVLCFEGGLPEAQMHVALLVCAVLNFAALEVLHSLKRIGVGC